MLTTSELPDLRTARALRRRSFVRNDDTFLEDQLKLAHVVDVGERIGADDDQVGELADFDGAEIRAHAAQRGRSSWRRSDAVND